MSAREKPGPSSLTASSQTFPCLVAEILIETGASSLGRWGIALLSLLIVIVASLTHFHAHLAFTYPHRAFAFGGPFWAGLGGGLLIGIYDYLGYNTTAYMAAELKDPGRVLPRSILYSVFGTMVAYLAMNIGVLGVVPW